MRTHSAASSDTGSTPRAVLTPSASSVAQITSTPRSVATYRPCSPSTQACSSAGGMASSRARAGLVLDLDVAADRVHLDVALERGERPGLGVEQQPARAAQHAHVGDDL